MLGQPVSMLGYPTVDGPDGKPWDNNSGLPVVKPGYLAQVANRYQGATWLLLAVQGNRGFSGGPVVPNASGQSGNKVRGLVVRTTAEEKDRQLYRKDTLTPVKEDAGYTWAVGAEAIKALVQDASQQQPHQ